ncbi:MAG: PQQ-dependent sugar dehydrogenase [Burkholderiaceae bacterium]
MLAGPFGLVRQAITPCVSLALAATWLALPAAAQPATPAAAKPLRTEVLASDLEHPWALAFLPGGRFLVTERPGRLRVLSAEGKAGPPVEGVPAVVASGQGGLLDVLLDHDFAANRTLYLCYSEPENASSLRNSTALAKARLSADSTRLEAVQIIFSQQPKFASDLHFGCRISERHVGGQPDGTLFLTLGDRYSRAADAQKLDNHHGKVVRIGKDGSVPKDNPFAAQKGALPEIWSYGHRNMQGAARAPDGSTWTHEHGPQGGDEINLPQAGRNYGWPVITFGEQYGGGKIGAGITEKAGLEPPLHQWTPSIAPSGMAFVTSARYPAAWQGNLLVGSLKFRYLARLELQGGKVQREHKLLADVNERIRDVRQGPDGFLYVVTDSARGRLIRLLPP